MGNQNVSEFSGTSKKIRELEQELEREQERELELEREQEREQEQELMKRRVRNENTRHDYNRNTIFFCNASGNVQRDRDRQSPRPDAG